jgi:hypothetical protein
MAGEQKVRAQLGGPRPPDCYVCGAVRGLIACKRCEATVCSLHATDDYCPLCHGDRVAGVRAALKVQARGAREASEQRRLEQDTLTWGYVAGVEAAAEQVAATASQARGLVGDVLRAQAKQLRKAIAADREELYRRALVAAEAFGVVRLGRGAS